MRHLATCSGLMLLVACGGGGTDPVVPPAPPPAPPGAPASLAVQAGDNQEAVPGATVAVRPAVVVKDQAGRTVPGVAVTFAVDSGGGSVANPSVLTGTDGVATAGAWTLGPAEGGNVLTASAGTISVRIRAQAHLQTIAIADQQAIGAGGGAIHYAKAGDPLNGFTLTVPAGAYPGSQLWTVSAKPSYPVVLPAGLRQVGGAVEISNDQGFANKLLTIRIPVRVGLDTAVSALIYDPSTGYLEGMGVAARDSVSITVITRHVGNRFLWQPVSPLLRASASPQLNGGFLSGISIVLASMPLKNLASKVLTNFKPIIDAWEFGNLGSAITPLGNAAGMGLSSLFHFSAIKPLTGRILSGLFDSIPGLDWDNPQGIRLSSVLQQIFDQKVAPQAQADYQAIAALASKGQIPLDSLTLATTEINMLATGQPQVLQLSDPSGSANMVVAFSADNSTNHDVLHILDTSRPGGVGDSVVLSGGLFGGIKISGLLGGVSGSVLRSVLSIGNSSSTTGSLIASLFQQAQAGTVGNGIFPSLSHLAGDLTSFLPKPLAQLAGTLLSSLKFENDCLACGGLNPALAAIFDRLGAALPNPATLLKGTNQFGILGTDPAGKFVDFHWFTTEARTLTISPDTATGFPGDTLRFVAHPQGFAPPGAIYTWNFGDGTTSTSAAGDSIAVKVYSGPPATGTLYPLSLTIRDSTTAVVGRAKAHARIITAKITVEVAGTWDPIQNPPNGTYAYQDGRGARVVGIEPGLDFLFFAYNGVEVAPGDTAYGVNINMVVATGTVLKAGDTFTPTVRGTFGSPGQFRVTLDPNQTKPTNTIFGPDVTSGILTIDSLTKSADGFFVAYYSFRVLNGLGGVTTGSGVGRWK